VPYQIATVLVALALMEGRPIQIKVGNVTSVPPPATELTDPAAKAAPNAANARQGPMEARPGSAIRENMRQKFSLTSAEAHAIVTVAKNDRYDANGTGDDAHTWLEAADPVV
jgi:hypothetical protein